MRLAIFLNALTALRSPLTWVRYGLLRLALRTGSRVELRGVNVVDISGAKEGDLHIDKLSEALELMAQFAPDELEYVRQNLDKVVVFTGSEAQYIAQLRACFMDVGYVNRQSQARIAMSLVHEATHAAFFGQGISYLPKDRARIEELCVEAEIRFASRVPGTERLIEEAKQHLLQPWWTDERLFVRRLERLRRGGWPGWFVACYEWLFRPRP